VPSVPAQRVITAHLIRLWPSHQYLLGDISASKLSGYRVLNVSRPALQIPMTPFLAFIFPTPATDSQVQADPSLKEKAWHLTWMLLAFLTSLWPQRQPTRFTGEIWVNFFCSGARRTYSTAACSRYRTHAMCFPEICARSVRGSRAHL